MSNVYAVGNVVTVQDPDRVADGAWSGVLMLNGRQRSPWGTLVPVALVAGPWDEACMVEVRDVLYHNEYPHTPGYLYDCQACEAVCHCEAGSAACVACEAEGEAWTEFEADALELAHDAYEASGQAGAYMESDL